LDHLDAKHLLADMEEGELIIREHGDANEGKETPAE
jgi:hypothetical protein